MTKTSLIFAQEIFDRLHLMARLKVETAGVLLVKPIFGADGSIKLLARDFLEVPEQCYLIRTFNALEISSDGYVHALKIAENTGATPIWFHTHPGNNPTPVMSIHDEKVNSQLTDLFRLRSGGAHYGALVISPKENSFDFTGFIDDGITIRKIDRVLLIGEHIEIITHFGEALYTDNSLFGRNILAFGGEIQHAIGELRIAIVGCGGTGSAVAEQLVRLGARHFDIYDTDVLSISNVTRVYGSKPSDVELKKVDILGKHLLEIAPDSTINRIDGNILLESIAQQLVIADVIFGCTDDNAGRLVLSRIPTFFLIPVIDCAVLLKSDSSNRLTDINGRISILTPGSPCLVCIGRIDLDQAAAERMDEHEHHARQAEGYAPALPGVEPAVVSFTSMVASIAVSEFIERLVGYGPPSEPHEVLLRLHDREMSSIRYKSKPLHYCDPSSRKIGLGMTSQFLEVTW